MSLRFGLCLFSMLAAMVTLTGNCLHAQAAPLFGGQETPIHIEANKMTSLEKERAVVFSGDVKVKQGKLLINSDEMTVYHAEQGEKKASPAGQPQIEKMHAKGNVEIVQDDFVATGDEAEYFSSTGKVIVSGNAKIIQNNNMITGHRVEMSLKEGSTVIIPDEEKKGRVKGYFYPSNVDRKEAGHGDTGN